MLARTMVRMSRKGFCCCLKVRSLLYTRFQMRATDTTANTIRVPGGGKQQQQQQQKHSLCENPV
jgi:hypothetical protein